MRIIIGLGNPGKDYEKTRHNAGFRVIDLLCEKYEIQTARMKFHSMIGEGKIAGEKVLLVKPTTYMNNSGEALGPMLSYYKMNTEDLTVIHDDMDIPAGTVRIRKKGGSGGHNGLKSIIAHVGSEDFARVRIGIGRPLPGWTVINHVLAPFSAEDAQRIREAITYLLPAMECIVTGGADLAMNRYNPHKKKMRQQEGSHDTENGEKDTREEG